MRGFLIHMNYGGEDICFTYLLGQEVHRCLKEGLDFFFALSNEKLSTGGNDGIYESDAVFTDFAVRCLDSGIGFLSVGFTWLNYVEVVMAF